MVGVVEHVGGGLVDGGRPCGRRGIRQLSGVQAEGLEPEFSVAHGQEFQFAMYLLR